jgi:hypothetical protein
MSPCILFSSSGLIGSDAAIQEVYAKTSTGNFVVAKKSSGVGELYLQVGRNDASLTDAERESNRLRDIPREMYSE